jgi:predicted permease
VRFLLMESAILAVAGAATGLLMAWWGVDALKQLAPQNIPRLNDVGFSGATFLFALGTAALTSMLFGLGPAVQLMRTPIVSLIGGRAETGHGRTRWSRSTLLVVEVGLSLVLLVGAGLLLRSMSRLYAIEPGWRSEGITILTLSLPSSRYPDEAGVVRGFDRLDERFEAIPGVAAVARIDIMPLGPGEIVRSFRRTDRPVPGPGELPGALYCVVDPDYFPTAGIPLVSGRYFDGRDRDGGPPVLIISREMADRFWQGEDPVGKAVQIGTSRPTIRTIVGVVEGVRSASLSAPPQPEMYVPHAQTGARSMTFLLASALPPAQLLAAAREVVRDMDARLPLIRPGTFATLESAALARPRFYLLLLSLFALLAVALAAVGVYGVVAYIVTQRTREIAVRVALGARTSEVLRLVMWQGLRPALAGIALGLLAALGAGRVLSGLLYQIEPADPATIATVIVLLVAIVAVACAVPALRAARIPAANALRTNH